jgi:hypothetical protein
MLQWVAQNSELVNALTGVGTLLVWVVYLQVFVSSYRRQLRATLLITRGAGEGLEGRCFLSNMSSGSVFVQSVLVTLETADKTLICPVTDVLDLDGDAPDDPRQRTRQGPLASGETRDIGSFGDLIRHTLHTTSDGPEPGIRQAKIRVVMIEIVGIYGSEDLPIGARRRFALLEDDGRLRFQGEGLQTKQLRSRRQRRRLVTDLERDR